MKPLKKLIPLGVALASVFAGPPASGAELKVGSEAPRLSGIDQDGDTVDLGALYASERFVLVYFYPKAGTPGCTAQACSLRDEYVRIQKRGIRVLGVSTDTVEAQKKFQKKHLLPFQLISDRDQKWAQAFGVPVKMGFASRQAFLIEKGKVIWLDRSASTKEQAQDVIAFLQESKRTH